MLKHTSLYPLHLELGAKMAPFAGYEMPIHYAGGILHEHRHCRSQAGLFDISHMGQCLIPGDSAADELERLTPGGIAELIPGQMKYTVLTNDQGGIVDDIIVIRRQEGLMLIVNAACAGKDYRHLRERLSDRCRLRELPEQALLALQGPRAAAVMRKYSADAADLTFMHAVKTELNGFECLVSRSGYTGEDGFEISLENRHAERLARELLAETEVDPVGLGARDTLRLEAGLCLYGHELDEKITPVEAGLQWLIKKGHRDFPGAGKIYRQLEQGTEQKRVGLAVEGKIPVREGGRLKDENGFDVGRVTSGGFAPSLDRSIAMAFVRSDLAVPGVVLHAKVRSHQIALTVTRLPFISLRYRR
jgi:aminomethyltransferase